MTTATEITIGEATITLDYVDHTHTTKDGNWLRGVASVTWEAGAVRRESKIDVGCWTDTDDDNAEWCASEEGAHVIERCLGGGGKGDTRGTFVRLAFAAECESLGLAICSALREAAAE